MGEAGFLQVRHQPVADIIITVIALLIILVRAHPAGQVQFIHTPWRLQ